MSFKCPTLSPAQTPTQGVGPELERRVVERPLNICYLIDELRTGGTETQLLKLIGRLDRDRVSPHLCLLDGNSRRSRELEPSDCPVARLGVRKLLSPRCLLQATRFRRMLREWKIDVLQVHFPDSTYFGVPVAKWAGVPHVVRTRRDLFYWVTPTHRRWGRRLDQFYNRHFVDAMVVNSDAVKAAAFRDERPAPSRIEVIPNGLDLLPYSSNGRPSRNGEAVRIGIVAMLRREKRVDLFIRAATIIAERDGQAEFLIAGDGAERGRLERMIQEAGLEGRVKLLGAVDDVPAFLGTLDVGVLCSDTEGLSNSLIEYMAAGLGIVASAVGGNLELLSDGETALLIPPGDESRLAESIWQLMNRPEQREAMGTRARSAVKQKYELGAIARRYEDLYHSITGRPSAFSDRNRQHR